MPLFSPKSPNYDVITWTICLLWCDFVIRFDFEKIFCLFIWLSSFSALFFIECLCLNMAAVDNGNKSRILLFYLLLFCQSTKPVLHIQYWTCQSLFSHHNTHIYPSSHSSLPRPSIDTYCTSSQTHFQAASRSPRSLSSYTRERCGRDPISSSDWISGSRRAAWELLTPPLPQYPPFLRPYMCSYPCSLIYFL